MIVKLQNFVAGSQFIGDRCKARVEFCLKDLADIRQLLQIYVRFVLA